MMYSPVLAYGTFEGIYFRASSYAVPLAKDGIGRFHEQNLDSFFVKVRRGAFLPAVKLMVALPDYLAVFIIGVPDLGAIPASAVAAFYSAGECAHPCADV